MPGEPLIAIFGPTAVGKTAIAVALAERLASAGAEPVAISADALAVYREIPILTGAPTSEQMSRLEHRLVGIRSVTEEFSAGEFADLAHSEIDRAVSAGRRPIVVGGTGLYMRAAVSELDLRSPVPDAIRARWQDALTSLGPLALHRQLLERAPDVAARIEPTDGRRVTRALELLDAGQPPPAPSRGLWSAKPRVATVAIGLTRDSAEHRELVAGRAEAMLAGGGREEVQAAEALTPSKTARSAIGWNEMLEGDLEGLTTKTWQLVRRQRTWMRKMEGISQLDISGLGPTQAADMVIAQLERVAAVQHRS